MNEIPNVCELFIFIGFNLTHIAGILKNRHCKRLSFYPMIFIIYRSYSGPKRTFSVMELLLQLFSL